MAKVIAKKSWTAIEDSQLLKLVSSIGNDGHWTEIASHMENRTGKQCRERYHNHLKADICKSAWSQEEDALLNKCQKEMGNQWAKIAKLLPGRSDNSVKNRWHIINRKKNDGAKTSKPTIPKLSLGNMAATSQQFVLPPAPIAYDDDLLSLYYSHDSHAHCREATDSSRSDLSAANANLSECVPGSGRRDTDATAAAPFDFTDPFDNLLDEQSRQLGCLSFNNTLSSCISELTSNTYSADIAAADEDDSWIDDIMDDDKVQHNSITPLDVWEAFDNDKKVDVKFSAESPAGLNFDTFSEAALSFRDMDSVLDEMSETSRAPFSARSEMDNSNCEEEEDLANFLDDSFGSNSSSDEDDVFNLFEDGDLIDGSSSVNTTANNSIANNKTDLFGKSGQLGHYITLMNQYSKTRGISPRTTPRSPVCPHVKRQRGGLTPRSPFNPFKA